MKLRSFVMVAIVLAAVTAGVRADSLGPIYRLSAEFQYGPPFARFSSTTASQNGADGTVVYTKTLFVPRDTLFVTFHATADGHFGAGLLMACLVDGVPCRPEPGDIGTAPSGWVSLLKLPAQLPVPETALNCNDSGAGSGDCHLNNINYSWCTTLSPGVHTVELKLASSISGRQVAYERAHIYIDNAGRRGWDDDDDDDDDDRGRFGRANGCAAAPAIP